MRLALVPKSDLTSEQSLFLDERLEICVKSEGESGPVRAWRAYANCMYAFVIVESQRPIAVAEGSGRPVAGPGWWIDPDFRGQHYGSELVDLLAAHLKADGVTEIGNIPIQTPGGKYDLQSRCMVMRLRSYFEEPG